MFAEHKVESVGRQSGSDDDNDDEVDVDNTQEKYDLVDCTSSETKSLCESFILMSAFFYRGWQVTNQFRPYSHDASIKLFKLKVLLFLEALIVNITISPFLCWRHVIATRKIKSCMLIHFLQLCRDCVNRVLSWLLSHV